MRSFCLYTHNTAGGGENDYNLPDIVNCWTRLKDKHTWRRLGPSLWVKLEIDYQKICIKNTIVDIWICGPLILPDERKRIFVHIFSTLWFFAGMTKIDFEILKVYARTRHTRKRACWIWLWDLEFGVKHGRTGVGSVDISLLLSSELKESLRIHKIWMILWEKANKYWL